MTRSRELRDWIPLWLRILDHLGTRGHEDSDVFTLSNTLGHKPPAVRKSVQTLESVGLVESEKRTVAITVARGTGHGIEDREIWVYRLTEEGHVRLAAERARARRFGGGA